MTQQADVECALERAAKASYENYMAGLVGCCEPAWHELPLVYKFRLIEAQRAAIAAMQTWQPIETAPRDGTKVLIYVPVLKETFAARFENGTWQHGVWVADRTKIAPTLWAPLPAPPEDSNELQRL